MSKSFVLSPKSVIIIVSKVTEVTGKLIIVELLVIPTETWLNETNNLVITNRLKWKIIFFIIFMIYNEYVVYIYICKRRPPGENMYESYQLVRIIIST